MGTKHELSVKNTLIVQKSNEPISDYIKTPASKKKTMVKLNWPWLTLFKHITHLTVECTERLKSSHVASGSPADTSEPAVYSHNRADFIKSRHGQ